MERGAARGNTLSTCEAYEVKVQKIAVSCDGVQRENPYVTPPTPLQESHESSLQKWPSTS